jgi:hypothetical protein
MRRAVAAGLALALVAGCQPRSEPPAEPDPAPAIAPPAPAAETAVAGAAAFTAPAGPSWAPAPREVGGLRTLATAGPRGFALSTAHGPVTFLAGVNVGSTTPGHQPGELAIGAADYRGWFAAMHRLGVRTVRVYTIHRPEFYRELDRHNRAHPDSPLYLVQGVYLPTESYVETGDLFEPGFTAVFRTELRDAVAAVHGELRRDPQPGRASGRWDTDVSAWLCAWLIGVEWEPEAVRRSDVRNAAAPAPAGRYFRAARAATPTERWLAARMDELATAEAGHGVSVPVAFVNWPTTDPLRHPQEPNRREDLVGIDANHVLPTPAWPGGTFASYHVYPYYPDFQRHEPGLWRYRYAGRADPYAGYLDALRRHHRGMPVLATEFGLPSSLGVAHHGPLGRHQGGHDERVALAHTAGLLRLIRAVGLAGGLVFAWTDEWFKLTWNTVAHQVPADRRQLWHDPLTNEQYFGLVATDPSGWANPNPARLGDRVTARVDESYVYLDLTGLPAGPVTLGLDAVPTVSGEPPPGSTDRAADTAFTLDRAAGTGQVWIRAELDPVPLDYPVPPGDRPAPVDGWQRFQLVTNRALVVPGTTRTRPTEFADVGALRAGRWEPGTGDSRSLWRVDGEVLRVRIPWAMAGLADPSSRQALVPGEAGHTRPTTGIGLSVSAGGTTSQPGRVVWRDWQRVGYRQRLKPGAELVRAAMIAVTA